MRCGHILLADYPFTDDSGSKVRPVLVVSIDEFNKGDDLVVVPISSVLESSDPYAFHVPAKASFFKDTGLRQASSIKWTKPMAISRRVFQRRLGHLARGPLSEIQSKLQALFQS